MANAPEVGTYPYPEALPHTLDPSTPKSHYAPDTSYQFEHPNATEQLEQSGHRKILGLRRRTFWILAIVILLIAGAVVGGSVGGSLAVRNSRENRDPPSAPTTASQTQLASATSPQTTNSPSASPTNSIYVPWAFTEINRINITCPSEVYVSGADIPNWRDKYRYICTNNQNMGRQEDDITAFTAYTLQQCVDACSQWNEVQSSLPCVGIVINSRLGSQRSQGNGANCWLKSSVTLDNVNKEDNTFAQLIR